jgi:TusA-related sulfurtransferase
MYEPRNANHRILVIANRTCPCPTLADEIARQARGQVIDVLVVAPALNSRLRHWVSDVDGAVARAQERLVVAVAELRERGIAAHGEVGDADPLMAIEDALASFAAQEIVVVTHPPEQSNWLERGLIDKAVARFDVPIVHLVSDYGLAAMDIAA